MTFTHGNESDANRHQIFGSGFMSKMKNEELLKTFEKL